MILLFPKKYSFFYFHMSYMLVKVVGETEEEIFLPVQKSDCFEGNILHWSGDFVRMAKWIL